MQIGKEMAIPSILKIGNGALGKIGGYLKAENLDQVVLFFGNGLIDMFGELVMNSLKEAEVNVLEYNELDTVDIDDIITLAFAIPNKAKAVISIGGGKVIDAGKYAAFLRNLPFISVPTSSSSDGFSSASASLLVQGKRTSVPARRNLQMKANGCEYGKNIRMGVYRNGCTPFCNEQLQSILEQKVKKQRKEKHRKIRKSFRELPFLDALR